MVTKSLQKRGHTLALCREDINKLVSSVENRKGSQGTPLYNCMLGTYYISESASIVTHELFESAVIKIQEGRENALSRHEKRAVSCLLKEPSSEDTTQSTNDDSDYSMPMAQQIAKRRKKNEYHSKYVDCSFILGSVAEVERLWSSAKHILSEQRQLMTPLLFEALLFLKLNIRFWDESLVSDAYKMYVDSLAESD